MVRFHPNYPIFSSVATIRVYKTIFCSAFSFDQSCIKNKLKESENHEDSQDCFSLWGMCWFYLVEKRVWAESSGLDLRQSPGVWGAQPRMQGPTSWKGGTCRKVSLETAIHLGDIFWCPSNAYNGLYDGNQTKSSSSKEQRKYSGSPVMLEKQRLKFKAHQGNVNTPDT